MRLGLRSALTPHEHGQLDHAGFFQVHEHFARFLTTEHDRPGPWHYFVPYFVAGILPWLTVLGWGACHVLDRYRLVRIPEDVYQIAWVPFRLLPGDATVVLVGALLVCFLATLYPARGAAGLDPAEALRYE